MRSLLLLFLLASLWSCKEEVLEGGLPSRDIDNPLYETKLELVDSFTFRPETSDFDLTYDYITERNDSFLIYPFSDGVFYCIDLHEMVLVSTGMYKDSPGDNFREAHLYKDRYVLTRESSDPYRVKIFDINNGQLLVDGKVQTEPNYAYLDCVFYGDYLYIAESENFANSPSKGQFIISRVALSDPSLSKEELFKSDTIEINWSLNLVEKLTVQDNIAYLSYAASPSFYEERYFLDRIDLAIKTRVTVLDTILKKIEQISLTHSASENYYCYILEKNLKCFDHGDQLQFSNLFERRVYHLFFDRGFLYASSDRKTYSWDVSTGIMQNTIQRTAYPAIADHAPIYGSYFYNYDTRTDKYCCFDVHTDESLSCIEIEFSGGIYSFYHPSSKHFIVLDEQTIYKLKFPFE